MELVAARHKHFFKVGNHDVLFPVNVVTTRAQPPSTLRLHPRLELEGCWTKQIVLVVYCHQLIQAHSGRILTKYQLQCGPRALCADKSNEFSAEKTVH